MGGTQSSSIIATNSIYCKKGAMLTTGKLLEEMHLQWCLEGGKSKDDKDSNNKDEIALAATNAKKGGKKSNGRERKENRTRIRFATIARRRGTSKTHARRNSQTRSQN